MIDMKAYGDEEDNDPSEWVEVDVLRLLGPAPDGCEPKIHLFLRRFESSSPDWEEFLHDPLRHMLKKPGAIKGSVEGWPDFPGDDDQDPRKNVPGGALQEIRDDARWHVHTAVTNHHRKLSRIHAIVAAGMEKPPVSGSINLAIFKDATTPHPND